MDKMTVRGLDFDDDRWEDPSVSGWLMLYCIWLLFEIVMGGWSIFQLPYAPAWAKTLGYLTYLLPLYSLICVFIRLRDAVCVSIVSLAIFISEGIVNIMVSMASGNISAAVSAGVSGVLVNIIWIVYFCRSRLVSVRFPKEERRVFVSDWILIVMSVALCLLLNLSTLGNLGNYKRNSSEEYRETLEAAGSLRGLNDQDVHFVDCAISGKYCIVYFRVDDINMSKSDFDALAGRPYFSDNLLFKMNKMAPGFIMSAIGDGLIIVLTVFRKDVGDGIGFKITPDQIRNLREPEPLPDLTEEEMDGIGKEVVGMLPPLTTECVTLESCEWSNEVVLSVSFTVDESKTRYINAYDSFKEYCDEVRDLYMENRTAPALDAIWSRNMSVKFVLKESKSGYSQEIPVF